jgi:hypothetical protein
MISTNTLFFAEMALFSGVVIAFGIREIIMLSPENIAKTEAKEAARKAAYEREEAARKSKAGHAEG